LQYRISLIQFVEADDVEMAGAQAADCLFDLFVCSICCEVPPPAAGMAA